MSIPKYILLLHQKLTGTLGEGSAHELDQWRKADAENETYARQTEKIWEAGGRYKSGFQPDTAAGFAQLKARMQAPEAKVVPLRPRFGRIAIAASIALLAGYFAWSKFSPAPAEVIAVVAVTTKAGEQRDIHLPDGSHVVLNENSRISYAPDMHLGTSRPLNLSGEAYFDIVGDTSRPFVITTDHAIVQVLGTAFNVRAYRNEAQTEVEVERGKVSLQGKSANEALILGAGQRGLCRPDGSLDRKKSPELRGLSWHTGKLAFRGASMDQVVQALERHYKTTIRLTGPATLADCPFSGNFDQASIETVMETIAVTLNAKAVKQTDGVWQISGGSCN